MGLFFRDSQPRDTQAPLAASAAPLLGRAQTAKYGATRLITASARRLDSKSLDKIGKAKPSQEWQRDAWVGYDRIGEVHYGFSLLANTFSRIRIFPAAITTSDEAPVTLGQAREGGKVNGEVARAAEELMGNLINKDFSSQARAFALNMSVAGECLLLEMPSEDPNNDDGVWTIKSTSEVVVEADKIRVSSRTGTTASDEKPLSRKVGKQWTPEINIGRIWRQHPQFSDEPDSSMRAIADSIEELFLINRLVRTVSRARLNAGMLFMPDTVTVVGGTAANEEPAVDAFGDPVTEPAVQDVNNFLSDLMDTMITPIEDESAASAVVPMLVTGPGDAAGQIKHITFDRKADEWLAGRAERALERILQGIDIPKDLVTGLANVKYSNAIQIDEDLYKTNIEPLALMFVDALTDIYLRPMLRARGISQEDADRVCVWYDPSEIVTRPNQSDEATQGFDRYLLSGEAWRRMHGFPETDAPSEEELALQLLYAKGSLPEDVTQALLAVALPKVLTAQREQNLEARDVPFPDSAQELLNSGTGPVDTESAPPDNEADTQSNTPAEPTEGDRA